MKYGLWNLTVKCWGDFGGQPDVEDDYIRLHGVDWQDLNSVYRFRILAEYSNRGYLYEVREQT